MFLKSIYLWCIHYFLGKLFQQLITCSEKKVQFCISGTVTVNELFDMPTIQLLVAIWKHVDTGLMENPCVILYTSTKSALLHLSPKDCRFVAFSLASYVMTLSSLQHGLVLCCSGDSTELGTRVRDSRLQSDSSLCFWDLRLTCDLPLKTWDWTWDLLETRP